MPIYELQIQRLFTSWMFYRIVEIDQTNSGSQGRFLVTLLHTHKYGYIERPMLDEWLHILVQVIQKVWRNVQLKQHTFNMKVSHDVAPSLYVFKPCETIPRMIARYLLRRRDLNGTNKHLG